LNQFIFKGTEQTIPQNPSGSNPIPATKRYKGFKAISLKPFFISLDLLNTMHLRQGPKTDLVLDYWCAIHKKFVFYFFVFSVTARRTKFSRSYADIIRQDHFQATITNRAQVSSGKNWVAQKKDVNEMTVSIFRK